MLPAMFRSPTLRSQPRQQDPQRGGADRQSGSPERRRRGRPSAALRDQDGLSEGPRMSPSIGLSRPARETGRLPDASPGPRPLRADEPDPAPPQASPEDDEESDSSDSEIYTSDDGFAPGEPPLSAARSVLARTLSRLAPSPLLTYMAWKSRVARSSTSFGAEPDEDSSEEGQRTDPSRGSRKPRWIMRFCCYRRAFTPNSLPPSLREEGTSNFSPNSPAP